MTFYRFAQAVVHFIMNVPYKIRTVDADKLPKEGGFILAANHHTNIDPLYIGIGFKRQVHFMAKEELFKNWFMRGLMKKLGAFPVARGKGDRSAIDKAVEIVKSGKVLGIFPEGTRSKDGKLMRLKSGAVLIASETGGDIVPVGIRYGEKRKFRRREITVVYGDMIKNEEIKIHDNSRAELKQAVEVLYNRINLLLEGETE